VLLLVITNKGASVKTKSIERYEINRHFITAIVYGDFSGIDDAEEASKVSAFIDEVGLGVIDIPNHDSSFARCDITGLHSDCVEIDVIKFEA